MTTIDLTTIQSLEEIQNKVSRCTKCEISKNRTKTVFSHGTPLGQFMIVGEGPGEHEDRTGIPFVGPAGDLLNKMLEAMGLNRKNDVYIANVIKCRAWIEENGRIKNRQPRIDEAQNCSEYLSEQIALVRPKVLLATGAPAAKALLGEPNFAITRQRGVWRVGPLGIPTMVTFHPAYILRLDDEDAINAKKLVWQDLKAVKSMLDGTLEPTLQNNKIVIEEKPKITETKQISLFS